ncbi:MAG: PAS domain S-box protein [Bacteroidales bacterium]|nr:PAS domain S-box protein [Bacteroidales bacterium]
MKQLLFEKGNYKYWLFFMAFIISLIIISIAVIENMRKKLKGNTQEHMAVDLNFLSNNVKDRFQKGDYESIDSYVSGWAELHSNRVVELKLTTANGYVLSHFIRDNNLVPCFTIEEEIEYSYHSKANLKLIGDFSGVNKEISDNYTYLSFVIFIASLALGFITWLAIRKNVLASDLQKRTVKLKESEIKSRALSEAAFEAVFISKKGICLEQNLMAEKMFGYNSEEAIGNPGTDWIIPEHRELVMQNMFSGYEKPYEVTALRKDRTIFPAEIHASMMVYKGENVRITSLRDLSERKKSEKQIKKLSTAVEQSANTIVITNTEGNIEYTNPKFTELTGYTAEEALGQNPRILNSGSQPKEYYIELWETIKAGKTWKGEFHNKTKDGKYFWENVTITPIKDSTEKIVNYLAIKEDISARKEAEQALITTETKLKSIFEAATNVSFITTDLDGTQAKILSYSPGSEKIFGYKAEEIIGKPVSILRRSEDVEAFPGIQVSLKKGKKGVTSEAVLVRKSGEHFPAILTIYPLADDKNNVFGALGVAYDITELKQTQLELITAKEEVEESEDLLNDIQQLTKVGGWEYNVVNQNMFWTNETYRIHEMKPGELDLSSKELIERGVECYYPVDRPKILEAFNNCVDNGKPYDLEFPFTSVKAKKIWIRTTAKAVKEKGKVVRVIGNIIDITDRKKSDEEIRAYNEELKTTTDALKDNNEQLLMAKEKAEESNKLKTEFLNNMSHEIRTPMNGIMGFSIMLNKPGLSEEKRNHFINIINNSSTQLLRIIDDILEISRLETRQIEAIENEICINDLLTELFSIFNAKAKENEISLRLKKGLADIESNVFIDDSKLYKILSNLIENSLKFTNKGFIEFGYQLKKNKLEFYVKDTGIGIKREKQEAVFERFSQEEKELSRTFGGLGLGLSIAKENTELLGGEITVKSKKGEGSIFYVTIPYKPVNTKFKENKPSVKKNNSALEEYSILIAEDDEVNFLYLEELLSVLDFKFKIYHAKNGKEAVDMCKSNPDINLILMDIKMPVMDGLEATKKIKKLRPELHIIAQTAYSTSEDKNKAISAGCNNVITKPISENDLNVLIKEYFAV